MATEQESDLSVGWVAVFITLHYDSLTHTTIERDRGNYVEKIAECRIDGKFRPCLILGLKDDHFRVWCGTSHRKPEKNYIRLNRVQKLDNEGFLELVPDAIRWIHRGLKCEWIGRQDREANDYVWEKLNRMMLNATKRSPQRRGI